MQGIRDWKKHVDDALRYIGISGSIDLTEFYRLDGSDLYRLVFTKQIKPDPTVSLVQHLEDYIKELIDSVDQSEHVRHIRERYEAELQKERELQEKLRIQIIELEKFKHYYELEHGMRHGRS